MIFLCDTFWSVFVYFCYQESVALFWACAETFLLSLNSSLWDPCWNRLLISESFPEVILCLWRTSHRLATEIPHSCLRCGPCRMLSFKSELDRNLCAGCVHNVCLWVSQEDCWAEICFCRLLGWQGWDASGSDRSDWKIVTFKRLVFLKKMYHT